MKKYIIPFIALTLLLSSCFDEEDELMQPYVEAGDVSVDLTVTSAIIPTSNLSNSYVGFIINEVEGSFEKLEVRVYLKANNTSAIIDEFTSVPEGELQYTIPELASAVGYSVDQIKAKDEFSIEVLSTVSGVTSASADASFKASVIFVDRIAGLYDIYATSYGDPGNWDEFWPSVLVSPNENEAGKYFISGIAGGALEIVGEFDLDAGTVSIAPNQNIGDVYGYGNVAVIYGDGSENQLLIGTLNDADSSIVVDQWGHVITEGANEGYVWDVFSTEWTKR